MDKEKGHSQQDNGYCRKISFIGVPEKGNYAFGIIIISKMTTIDMKTLINWNEIHKLQIQASTVYQIINIRICLLLIRR